MEQNFWIRDGLAYCLDKLGYSKEMISYRRKANKYKDEIHNRKAYPLFRITTGSKAEGTALYFESDIDRMFEVTDVVCFSSNQPTSCPLVFTMVREGCAPGYTRLKLQSENCHSDIISKYLVTEEDDMYISNDFTVTEPHMMLDINSVTINKLDKTGPSTPYGNSEIKYDFVYGFECIYQDYIERWVARPRFHGWPDTELLKSIESLHGSVVPVANKETKYPRTEWRICYTKADILLMESLDEFQIKLYILLKHMATSVLRPICSEISSYIMKNILFWMVETKPKECFAGSNLINRLTDGLGFLKECLHKNTLMSYMIEDRNLLQGRVREEERSSLISELDCLLNKKENMLMRCGKIWFALVTFNQNPDQFSEKASKRDKIEQLVLKKSILFKEMETLEKPELAASSIQLAIGKYDDELHNLVLPDRDQIKTSGQNLEEVFKNRLSTFLS